MRPLLVAALIAALVPAQTTPPPIVPTIGAPVNYTLASGILNNGTAQTKIVWTGTVSVPGGQAMQLKFDTATLGSDEDAVIIRNPSDGQSQRLTRYRLAQWHNHTAWFNTDTLHVSVELAPGSTGNVLIRKAFMGVASGLNGSSQTICGTSDNRTLSNDARVCRLVKTATSCTGCTGWLISATNTILGAGHCAIPAPDFFVIAEFNTPASTATGCAQHPPVADQYPVDQSTILAQDNGVGDDWGVARLHPNSSGQTAFDNQGAFFTLATSSNFPAFFSTVRVTGNGDDSNTPTRAFDQQTHTGLYSSGVGNIINHMVDTEPGNSGSPIIHESSGRAIGIHTNGGCSSIPGSFNSGTSILNSALQTAINDTRGAAGSVTLTTAASFISNDFTVFDVNPLQSRWVGVGITSASNWNIDIEGTSSALSGTSCDYLIANGTLGAVPPVSGELDRVSGSSSARAEYASANVISLGAVGTATWGSADVLKMWQIYVPSSGTYDLTVTGPNNANMFWRLYAPGTNSDWRPRSSTTLVTNGSMGNNTYDNISLSAGVHCIVVYKNGGVGAVSPTAISVSLCNSSGTNVLSLNSPETITDPCEDFTISPTAGRWNVVGVTAPAITNWNIALGQANANASGVDFVVANGHNGSIGATQGFITRASGILEGRAEFDDSFTMTVGSYAAITLSSGEVFDAYEFNITSPGTYNLAVSGDSSAWWRLYSPGTDAAWRRTVDAMATGLCNGNVNALPMGSGYHLLLVYRATGTVLSPSYLRAMVCQQGASINMSGFGRYTVTDPCTQFTCAPEAGRWNAVGIRSDSNWNMILGSGYSTFTGDSTDFVVANGHAGTITATTGLVSRSSGTDNGVLQRSYNITLNMGTQFNANWPADYVVRIFEFDVPSTGNYDITIGNDPTLKWRLFIPGVSPIWRDRGDASYAGVANGAPVTRSLSPGWHAICVYHDEGTIPSTIPFTVKVEPTPNPVPSGTSISPTTILANSPGFTLTFNGSNFVNGAVVRWNGTALPTTYVSSTTLTATVSSTLLQNAGLVSVTAENPAPGGGSTGTESFTILNPVPTLTSMSPTSRTAGSSAFTLTCTGTNFNTQTYIRWNTQALATNYISPTQVSATVSSSLIANAGTASITVRNPVPAGGISSPLSFTVNNPVPTTTAINPSQIVIGTASTVMTISGSNFVSGADVRVGTTTLTPSSVSSNSITVSVPAAAVGTTAGNVSVRVNNPSPGGGFSNPQTLTALNPVPTVTSISPTTVISGTSTFTMNVNGTGFTSASEVRLNGAPLTTTFVNANQVQALVLSVYIVQPGVHPVEVYTPGPGGGTSASVNLTVEAPVVNTIVPAQIPIMTPASPPVAMTIIGSGFHAGTVGYADGYALPTTFINPSTLAVVINPSVLGTQRDGALAIAVENTHVTWSNSVPCEVGPSRNNQGTGVRHPLAPFPGEAYVAHFENGMPNMPLLMLLDLTNPTPVAPWPSPASNFVLSVRDTNPGTGDWIAIVDGIGVFGPPSGAAYDANGEFTIGGFTLPTTPWGIQLTVQGAFIDPTAPQGFTVTWPRFPDEL